jgi:hypothetical protein
MDVVKTKTVNNSTCQLKFNIVDQQDDLVLKVASKRIRIFADNDLLESFNSIPEIESWKVNDFSS